MLPELDDEAELKEAEEMLELMYPENLIPRAAESEGHVSF